MVRFYIGLALGAWLGGTVVWFGKPTVHAVGEWLGYEAVKIYEYLKAKFGKKK